MNQIPESPPERVDTDTDIQWDGVVKTLIILIPLLVVCGVFFMVMFLIEKHWDTQDNLEARLAAMRRRNAANMSRSGNLSTLEEGRGQNTTEGSSRAEFLLENLQICTVLEGSLRSVEPRECSFRAAHPKGDLKVSPTTSDGNSTSCPICLEDFQVNDTICWSKNPNCHHSFHFDCAFSWLEENDDCPICRRVYVGSNF